MWSNLLLILLLSICVFTDLRERKIYNAVLLPFFCIGMIINILSSGLSGLEQSFLGMIVGLGILFVPYLLGGMGAGDVKLLAVIGAVKGMMFVLMAAFYMALAGGILALLVILFHKGIKTRLYQIVYFFHGLRHGLRFPILTDQESLKKTYPYGVAIAAGAVWQVFRSGGFPG
jgi:prepilin peptidase CpaA